MKKFLYFLILLVAPISVHASYGIENYRMDMTVLENGSVSVSEAFEMNGTYNGFERIVNYKSNYDSYYGSTLSSTGNANIYNGNGIKLNEIRGINFDINTPFESFVTNGDLFSKVDSANKGDYGVYVLSKTDNGETYTIYNHSKMNKDFYLSYTLEDMAIIHQDIAELGLNVFTEMKESIGHLEIIVHLPTNKTLLRVWAHGPLNGTSEIIDNQTVKIVINDLAASTAIDFRLAFDKEAIDLSEKTTGIEALDNILEIETRLADEANQKRNEEYEKLKSEAYSAVETAEKTKDRTDYNYALSIVSNLKEEDLKYELQDRLENLLVKIEKKEAILKVAFTVLITGWTVGLALILTYIYLKHDKEYKAEFKNKYYRDFPANYGPATVGYLIRKKVDNNDLSASILNLINMKVISYTSLDSHNKDYKFTKLKHNLTLTESDERLLKFLLEDQEEISLSELKKKANKNYEEFITNYSNWINRATIDAELENFYEDTLFAKLLGIIYSIIGIIVGILIIEQDTFITPFIMIVLGIIALIYCIAFTKRTKKGNEDRAKWLALKKFMEDFGTMDDKDLPEIILWEKYLVYAVTLGCANKLSKVMKLKLKNMNLEKNMDIDYFDRMIMLNYVMNSSVNNIVKTAYSAKSAANAASMSSSGGGFGGGFSGSGGSFGGGGGGGRF